MDDTEYYAMMRRQYSHTAGLTGKRGAEKKENSSTAASKTAGTFSEWKIKHGHEDAEMFEERNSISGSDGF